VPTAEPTVPTPTVAAATETKPPDKAKLPEPEPTVPATTTTKTVETDTTATKSVETAAAKSVEAAAAKSVEAAAAEPVEKAEPKPDVPALYKAGKYAEVVAACSASQLNYANATACTISACKTKSAAKAKRFFKYVGAAKKSAVASECDGVLPADKPATPDPCKADMMACQH
jgi:hypothetical protein